MLVRVYDADPALKQRLVLLERDIRNGLDVLGFD